MSSKIWAAELHVGVTVYGVGAAVVVLLAGARRACTPAPRRSLPTTLVRPVRSAGTLLEGSLGGGDSPCVVMRIVGEAPIGLAWPLGKCASAAARGPRWEWSRHEGVPVTVKGEIDFEPSATCHTQSSFRVDRVFKGTLPPQGA
jgi:hypothetical protein